MAEVSRADRATVRDRDLGRCVSCGQVDGLTMQHREAVGMGGSKIDVSVAGLLLACGPCNDGFEGAGQRDALANGWKLRRFRDHERWPAWRVPYYDAVLGQWYTPDQAGKRAWTEAGLALTIVQFANGS